MDARKLYRMLFLAGALVLLALLLSIPLTPQTASIRDPYSSLTQALYIMATAVYPTACAVVLSVRDARAPAAGKTSGWRHLVRFIPVLLFPLWSMFVSWYATHAAGGLGAAPFTEAPLAVILASCVNVLLAIAIARWALIVQPERDAR